MKRLIGIALALALTIPLAACQKKEALPQVDYPLTREVVQAALDQVGLDWPMDDQYAEPGDWYFLDEEKTPPQLGIVRAFVDDTYGPFAQMIFLLDQHKDPQNQWPAQERYVYTWEDMKAQLELAALLCGGLESQQEIYDHCAQQEFPEDGELILDWELSSGRYITLSANGYSSNKSLTIDINIFASKDAYDDMMSQAVKAARAE